MVRQIQCPATASKDRNTSLTCCSCFWP